MSRTLRYLLLILSATAAALADLVCLVYGAMLILVLNYLLVAIKYMLAQFVCFYSCLSSVIQPNVQICQIHHFLRYKVVTLLDISTFSLCCFQDTDENGKRGGEVEVPLHLVAKGEVPAGLSHFLHDEV